MFEEDTGVSKLILKRLTSGFILPIAIIILSYKSFESRVKSWFTRSISEVKGSPEPGAPILIFAMWEYGMIRPDVERALRLAREIGYFVIVVNTGKLQGNSRPEAAQVYLQIPNFGRDFASYQAGFKLLYKRGWGETTSRVVMANDSIYYNSRGLKELLTQAWTTELKAFGATENFEIERHLGSFFVSLSPDVVSNPLIRKFWFRYRKTDLRAKVIKRGELKFSKTLKKVVPESLFGAMFDVKRVINSIESDRETGLERLYALTFDSPGARHWKKGRLVSIGAAWRDKHRFAAISGIGSIQLKASSEDSFVITATSLADMIRELNQLIPTIPKEEIKRTIYETAYDHITTAALSGSQIHNSAVILTSLGLPLVKLDLLYRGAASLSGVAKLQKFMSATDYQHLLSLIISRPHGEDTLAGWRRAAFLRGLI